jgi:hypothetical protein
VGWQLAGIVQGVGSAGELLPRMTNDEEALDPASPLTGPEIVMLVEWRQ